MLQAKELRGTGVAIVTPFDVEGEVDFSALKRIVNYLLEGGVDYLVTLGTTAETATLSKTEENAVASCIYEEVKGRIPLLIGAGGNNTKAVVENIQQNEILHKFDGLLIASPQYNKPNQEGVFQHYSAIAKITDLPIVLYNVPSRTGGNIQAMTTLKLAGKYKNIIAIKEASGDFKQINTIINEKPKHFELISGDDALTLPMISLGAIGVISVLANALPVDMSSLVKAALDNDYFKAQQLQKELFPLMHAIFDEGNPTGIKLMMAERNLLENYLRLPLVAASPKLEAKLRKMIS